MKRALLVLAGLLVLGGLGWWLLAGSDDPGDASEPDRPVGERPLAEGEGREIELFFPGTGRLYPELRRLPDDDDPERRIEAALAALLAGPRSRSLRAPLPEGVELRAVRVVDGNAFLDLVSSDPDIVTSGGSTRERLAVYSLVHTVLANEDAVRGVVLLWNGVQPESFGGHLDTTRPLREEPSLVARSLPPPEAEPEPPAEPPPNAPADEPPPIDDASGSEPAAAAPPALPPGSARDVVRPPRPMPPPGSEPESPPPVEGSGESRHDGDDGDGGDGG